MKYRISFLVTLFNCYVSLFAQNNEAIVRVSQILSLKATEKVESEDVDLITTPSEKDDNTNLSIDITYLRKIKKTKWIIRLGFDKTKSEGELVTVSSDAYSIFKNENNSHTAKLGIGLYYPFFTSQDDRTVARFSFIGSYGYKFKNRIYHTNDVFDSSNKYLGGAINQFEFANSWRANIDLGISFYYYFFQKLGIGVEINIVVYYESLKGVTKQQQLVFDDKGIKVKEVNSNHHENKTTIGKTNPFSIGLSYQF